MSNPRRDKTISALEAIHAALKTLNQTDRERVLASVRTLLDIPTASKTKSSDETSDEGTTSTRNVTPSTTVSSPVPVVKPLAVRELIQDRKPKTHPQLITLFAYYREKHENRPSFSREDLKRYYTISRETPPGNFDRDFVKAIQRGWLHEDGDNSYITSKGIEAVASGFSGSDENKPVRKAKKVVPKKKRS